MRLTIVPFRGVLVTPGNLYPKPTTVADVKEIAKHYIDLTAYEEPQQENTTSFFNYWREEEGGVFLF